MLLKKAMFAISFLSLTFGVFADSNCNCDNDALPNSQYRRTVLFSQNLPWGGPVTPLDPNHSIALSLVNKKGDNLYTQAQVDAITNNALQELIDSYGIDFTTVEPSPTTGVRILPGIGVFLPFILGVNKNIPLIDDSEHPDRGQSHEWYYVTVGNLVSFSNIVPLPITAGINAGASIPVGSNWTSGEFNFLKNDSNKREIVRFTTTSVALRSTDQWGNRSFNFAFDIFDEENRQGLFLSTTEVLKQPPGLSGTYFLKEFPTFVWECENCFNQN
jgi:hypothetical protein